jgi:IS605 OrfB family transposase
MVITKKLKLYYPNKNKERLLLDVAKRQTACVNYWIERIREIKGTSIKELQSKFYYSAKKKFGFGSLMTQLAMYTAIRLVRTSKKKRINAPFLKKEIISISNIKVDKNNLGLVFGKGRIWIPFHSQEIPNGTIKESKIKKIGNDWYCFLAVDVKEPKIKKYKRFMGVDLGIKKIAVISDWNGNNTKFFRGGVLGDTRNHYLQLRKKLQPKIKQGNVYKLLKRIGNKESNWMRDTNHKISKEIIMIALRNKRSIALENLTDIRESKVNKKTRSILNKWSFRQLADFIKYKARLNGLEVSSIDPRDTSKTCPKCGFISRANRKSQERFKCNKCGYESNADRIGAINIAQRATELLAMPVIRGPQAIALI